MDFVRDAEIIIHNAAFDVGFLNNELGLLQKGSIEQLSRCVTDTLRMAREIRPGKKNNLNALCSEFGIDNASRTLHGALLDAELLAEVYLAMTRGQNSLSMSFVAPAASITQAVAQQRPPLLVSPASESELADHARVLAEIGKESRGKCVWDA